MVSEPRAVALTEAPETLRAFMKQRLRWTFGMLQVACKHAGALRKLSGVALTIGNIFIFQIALALFAPLFDIMLVLQLNRPSSFIRQWRPPEACHLLAHLSDD